MKRKRILFVYRTPRMHALQNSKRGEYPDSILFGFNHLTAMGYDVEFFDSSYSLKNLYHPLFYPLEHLIIGKVGMGFKLDQAFHLLPKIKDFDVIVATGDSAGLPILALKHHGLIKVPVIYMTAGLAGALKGRANTWVGSYYKKILRNADVFTSYSKVEIGFFEKEMGLPKGKIQYMPLGTDWEYFSKKAKKKRTIISAVGIDTGRDYKTLFDAVEGLPYKVEVACHPDNIAGLKVPDNVKVHLNIPVGKVRDIYQRSILTVVPCFERYRSAGQMVILEAASAGLPVIASRILGITGAFKFHNGKHLLFSPPGDSKNLRRKLDLLLGNSFLRERLGKSASNFVKVNYTTENLASNLAKYLHQL